MNFFGVGPLELVVILVVALVFVGPERLPKLAADIARTIREIRKYTGSIAAEFTEVLQEFEKETEPEKSQWKDIGQGLTDATKSVTDAFRDAHAAAAASPATNGATPATQPAAASAQPAPASAPAAVDPAVNGATQTDAHAPVVPEPSPAVTEPSTLPVAAGTATNGARPAAADAGNEPV